MVAVEDGLSLGLMIRGGAEYGLGIYVTGVDESSAADIAGLQVLILKCVWNKYFALMCLKWMHAWINSTIA